jgi:HEPN domain-containing protein
MMPTVPKFVNKDNYLRSKKLIKEAGVARIRAVIIHLCSKLETGYVDWQGAVEACQHCFELSLKSLWLMLGLTYRYTHNPAEDFDKVKERLFELFPYVEDQPLFKDFDRWIRERGEYMAKLHQTSIYGDQKGNYASELFTEEDVFKIWDDAALSYSFVLLPIKLLGLKLGLLTEEEKRELDSTTRIVQELKKNVPELEGFFIERLRKGLNI